jgi:CheY-like chemotaxis protein
MTILVMEDNVIQRSHIKAQLEPLGRRIVFAASGKEMLDFLKVTPPDLIIMDAVMPSMDGFKACNAIKSDPSTSDIPIIVVTSLSRDFRGRSYSAGADDFIRKHSNTLLLQMRVQTHLRIRSLGRRLGQHSAPTRLKVLVASAKPLVHSHIRLHLGRGIATYIEAWGETHAAEQIQGQSPDILVLDTDLLDGSAQALAVATHAAQATRHLPILLIHHPGELEIWSRYRECLSDTLEKPLMAQETRRRIAMQMRLARLQKLAGMI